MPRNGHGRTHFVALLRLIGNDTHKERQSDGKQYDNLRITLPTRKHGSIYSLSGEVGDWRV